MTGAIQTEEVRPTAEASRPDLTMRLPGTPRERSRTRPQPHPYLAPVPDSAPPFDDERTALSRLRALAESRRATEIATAVTPLSTAPIWANSALTNAAAITGPAIAAQRTVADAAVPTWSQEADIGIQRTTTSHLPPAARTGKVLARALIEVLSGLRPVAQLRVHCAPEVFGGLQIRPLVGRELAQLASVRVCEPADGVAEVSAVFRIGSRAKALAFRIQGVDGRWRIVALQTA